MSGKAHYLFRYTVEQHAGGHFPIDMLRYDLSCPASETAAGRIERTYRPGGGDVEDIELVRFTDNPDWWPTEARWSSFGWLVVDVEKERVA